MGYFSEKQNSNVYVEPGLSPGEQPYTTASRQSGFASLPDLEKRDLKYKRTIRVLRFISRLVTLILSAFMIGILSYALAKYYLTRNRKLSNGQSPWVTPATIWPTFMLLAISVITFFMSLITLCSYVCGVGAANRSASAATVVSVLLLLAHIIAWAVAAGLYKMAHNRGKDLWGYSCSSTADQIQAQVNSYLNFGRICDLQGGAYYASILQAIAYLLTFIITVLVFKRESHKKKIAKVRESLATETGYNQNVDTGDIYKPGAGQQYLPLPGQSYGR